MRMKRITFKSSIDVVNNYIVYTSEGTEYGVFFRSPIQKVMFSDMCNEDKFNCWTYINKLKSRWFRLRQKLLGNGDIVNSVKDHANSYDFAGFNANILTSIVYFKRDFREASVESFGSNTPILKIKSEGFENPYNAVSGHCEKETTIFTFWNDKKQKETRKGQYYNTYFHIVRDLLTD